ncbi:MAG: EAL domain-containing protein [Methylophilaceae bacterium]
MAIATQHTTNSLFAEDASSYAEALLRNLLDTSPDFVCFKDGQGRWLKANDNGLAIFHLQYVNYQFKTDTELAELTHPIYRDAFLSCNASDEMAWVSQQRMQVEETIPLPEGGHRVFDVVKTPLFNEDGSRQGLVVVGRDITERRDFEIQLTNRSTILDALISCDWLLNSAESWRKVVPDVLSILGVAADFNQVGLLQTITNAEGKRCASSMFQWIAPDCCVRQSLGGVFEYEALGAPRWETFLSLGQPVFGNIHEVAADELAAMEAMGANTLVLIPVTVNEAWWGVLVVKKCEKVSEISPQELGALMAAGRSLGAAIQREIEGARLNQAMIAFESAAEGIVITDADGHIIAINKGYADITGYSEDEVRGQLAHQLNPSGMDAEQFQQMQEALVTQGRWKGEITNLRKDGEFYPEHAAVTVVKDDEGKVINYVVVFSDISDTKRVQTALHEMVNHDALTGLPNRRLLNELTGHALRRAEREKTSVAILFIDLDRFKVINDTLGHHVGDKLLIEVSDRLRDVMRDSDTVARLGGDEFMVMMDSLRDVEDASRVAKKIVTSLQNEFVIEGKDIYIGASVGISVFPGDGVDVEELIKAADIAMYKVKSEGKNNYRFYSSDLSENAVERFNMESQLRRALERNQFEVYYQPQVSLKTRRIIGAEALVRWRHPELGLVPPSKFIPVAEEAGLVVQIGEWVLRESARQMTEWIEQGLELQSVSVNVSGVQVQRSNFADTVYGILVETGCDPTLLELEITESVVMNNTEYVISVFERIKEPGVRLAIDDFGTGYSSLSYLKRLPLDKLKIDQSFVRDLTHDPDDKAIAGAVIALARSLGLKVIAEGVETQDQVDMLVEMGCDDVQGYFYGKPVPALQFAAVLMKDKQDHEARS